MPEVTGSKPRPGSSYNGSCSVNGLEGNLVLIIIIIRGNIENPAHNNNNSYMLERTAVDQYPHNLPYDPIQHLRLIDALPQHSSHHMIWMNLATF